jgi:hypothetical protein
VRSQTPGLQHERQNESRYLLRLHAQPHGRKAPPSGYQPLYLHPFVLTHVMLRLLSGDGYLPDIFLQTRVVPARHSQPPGQLLFWGQFWLQACSIDVSRLLIANFRFSMALHSTLNQHPLASSLRGRRHSLMYVYPP